MIVDQTSEAMDERRLGPAMLNGARCRCPRCGEGKLYVRYLKIAPTCESCGLDLSQAEADDAPPYFTIFLVGHIVVPIMLAVQMGYELPLGFHMAFWPLLCAVLCIVCLPPVKGMVVAWQWAMRMHGFGDQQDDHHE